MYKYHRSSDRCSWTEVTEEDKTQHDTRVSTAEEETLKEEQNTSAYVFTLRFTLSVFLFQELNCLSEILNWSIIRILLIKMYEYMILINYCVKSDEYWLSFLQMGATDVVATSALLVTVCLLSTAAPSLAGYSNGECTFNTEGMFCV